MSDTVSAKRPGWLASLANTPVGDEVFAWACRREDEWQVGELLRQGRINEEDEWVDEGGGLFRQRDMPRHWFYSRVQSLMFWAGYLPF